MAGSSDTPYARRAAQAASARNYSRTFLILVAIHRRLKNVAPRVGAVPVVGAQCIDFKSTIREASER